MGVCVCVEGGGTPQLSLVSFDIARDGSTKKLKTINDFNSLVADD